MDNRVRISMVSVMVCLVSWILLDFIVCVHDGRIEEWSESLDILVTRRSSIGYSLAVYYYVDCAIEYSTS